MHFRTAWQQAGRRQRIGIILALLYLLYALLGYFLLSPLARDTLRDTLSEFTGRDVQVEDLTFNPLTLSVTVRGFAIPDADGHNLAAFNQFYANFQLSSLVRWSWHFDQISLRQPRVRLVRIDQETFNFSDLLAQVAKDDAAADQAATEDPDRRFSLPRFSFHQLALEEGDFRFRDQARAEPEDLALTPVSFHITDFSTRGDGEGGNAFAFSVTGPAGGQLDWAGNVGFGPLVAHGRLALSDVDLTPFAHFFREQVHFRIPSAALDIATEYHLGIEPDGRLQLSEGELVLGDLHISDPRRDEPVLRIPRLKLAQIRFDTQQWLTEIGRIDIDEPQLTARLQTDGVDLVSLFTPVEAADNRSPSPEPAPTPETDPATPDTAEDPQTGPAWQLLVRELAVNQGELRLLDETLPETGELVVAPVNLTVSDLALHRDEPFQLRGELMLADSGRLALSGNGTVMPLNLELELELEQLAVGALAPWLRGQADLRVADGRLGAGIRIRHIAGDGAPETHLDGSVEITDLDLTEPDDSALLGWSRLAVTGLAVALHEQSLALDDVQLESPAVHLRTDRQGRGTAARLRVTDNQSPAEPANQAASAPWSMRLGGLNVSDGRLHYQDQALPSPFEATLSELQISLGELASGTDTPAALNLAALIDGYSNLTVEGQLQPLKEQPFVDLDIRLDDYGMDSLTPYTGRHLGYAVSSGRLNVNTGLQIEDNRLDSLSQIRAAQFFLGERVPSEDALNVPIKLGLAVLRDQNGVIDLPVRARGDLGDPSVTVTGIILRTLNNIIVRAATAPFSMLSSLAGGRELDRIEFPPGVERPDDQGLEQIATLATLLRERPTLKLNLVGSAGQADRAPLAARALGEELMGDDWQGLASALEQRGFRRRVESAYTEQTGNSIDSLAGELSEADSVDPQARNRAVSTLAFDALVEMRTAGLPTARLESLALARAAQVRRRLIEDLELPAERVAVIQPRIEGDQVDHAVLLELTADPDTSG